MVKVTVYRITVDEWSLLAAWRKQTPRLQAASPRLGNAEARHPPSALCPTSTAPQGPAGLARRRAQCAGRRAMDGPPGALVGERVRKWFENPPGWYLGTVASFDPECGW